MADPVRLQLSRRKGFDLQALSRGVNGLPAANVARPGKYGNPYPVAKVELALAKSHDWAGRCTSPLYLSWAESHFRHIDKTALRAELAELAQRTAVALFAIEVAQFERYDRAELQHWLGPLRDKNLACWCELGRPCHADVLIELANRPVCEAIPSTTGADHE